MAAMFHNQGNPVFDYVWNTVRRRLVDVCTRNDGIKPFIQSVRQGGYYLPDQDHGAEHSEFVDFFATYKATPGDRPFNESLPRPRRTAVPGL